MISYKGLIYNSPQSVSASTIDCSHMRFVSFNIDLTANLTISLPGAQDFLVLTGTVKNATGSPWTLTFGESLFNDNNTDTITVPAGTTYQLQGHRKAGMVIWEYEPSLLADDTPYADDAAAATAGVAVGQVYRKTGVGLVTRMA